MEKLWEQTGSTWSKKANDGHASAKMRNNLRAVKQKQKMAK